jgi:hypothetical protein
MTWGQMRLQLVSFAAANGRPDIKFHVLNDALAEAYNRILGRRRWRKLNVDATLALVPPVTSGTVTVTQGSAAVTLADATWDRALNGRKFRIDGQLPWYVFYWLTATTAELDRPFEDATGAGQGYAIFQDEYELPDDCKAVTRVVDVRFGHTLNKRNTAWMDTSDPSRSITGLATDWAPSTSTTQSEIKRIRFARVPNEATSLQLTYSLIVTNFDGTNDGDTPLDWVSSDAIKSLAKAKIAREQFKDLALAAEMQNEFEAAVGDMHREEMTEQTAIPLKMDSYYSRRRV